MEKFAVDLDKVLDEFEENEEKCEKLAEQHGRPFSMYTSPFDRYNDNPNFALVGGRDLLYNEHARLCRTDFCNDRQKEQKNCHSSPYPIPKFQNNQTSQKINISDTDFPASLGLGQPLIPDSSCNLHISLPSVGQNSSKSTEPLISPLGGEKSEIVSWQGNVVLNNGAASKSDHMTCAYLPQYKIKSTQPAANSNVEIHADFKCNKSEVCDKPLVDLPSYDSLSCSDKNKDVLMRNDEESGLHVSSQNDDDGEQSLEDAECSSLLMRGDPDGEQGSSEACGQELMLHSPLSLTTASNTKTVVSQNTLQLQNPSAVKDLSSSDQSTNIPKFNAPVSQNKSNVKKDVESTSSLKDPPSTLKDNKDPVVGFQTPVDNSDISDSEIESYLSNVDVREENMSGEGTEKVQSVSKASRTENSKETMDCDDNIALNKSESIETLSVSSTHDDKANNSSKSFDSEIPIQSDEPLENTEIDQGVSADYAASTSITPEGETPLSETASDGNEVNLLDVSERPASDDFPNRTRVESFPRKEERKEPASVNNVSEDNSLASLDQLDGNLNEDDPYSGSYDGKSSTSCRVPRPTSLNIPSQVIVAPAEMLQQQPTPEAVSEQILSGVNENLPGTSHLDPQLQSTPDDYADGPPGVFANNASIFNNKDLVGKVKPFWIPDDDAASCMHCDMKFTMMKRRHHCRACGKVVCSQCSNQKAKLLYLDNKEARVCQPCFVIISSNVSGEISSNAQASSNGEQLLDSPVVPGSNANLPLPGGTGSSPMVNSPRLPNPNNPNEYCSTISPLEQAQPYLNRPPPTVMVPVGVLKRGDKPRGEPKQVMFSDGIRPGSDLTELDEPTEVCLPYRRTGRIQKRVDKVSPSATSPPQKSSGASFLSRKNRWGHTESTSSRKIVISDAEVPLPPVILPPAVSLGETPNMENLMQWLQNDQTGPVTFVLTKNLHVFCKIVKLDCCTGQECWNFTSCGMATVGQDEIVFVLERLPEENTFPHDSFRLFSSIYDSACKGNTVNSFGHTLFQGLFGCRENSGFLFVRSTFQCLNKLILPPAPYLIALLIQKWEVPWVKAFPLRLMLRLGAEFRCYPCPLVSFRHRKSVYAEIGHTIMNVLADFRNFQYTLPVVQGMVVHMEDRKTTVNFPRNRYELVMKVLNNSNEHVLTFGSNFSTEADSHLVCIQNEGGNYVTQAINIQDTPRKITGASFIVFSGALKAASGVTAKSSIVEDGLLVQIPQDTMAALRIALRDMKDYIVGCGPIGSPDPEEVIILQWTRDDKNFNIGVKSPVDGRSMDGVPSIRIHSGTDYAGDHHLIRWTEVFFLQTEDNGRMPDTLDPSRLAETVSQACCIALTPHLGYLVEAGFQKVGLRVTLGSEKVGYEVGSRGELLPDMYMNDLDSALIPVIMSAVTTNIEQSVVMELIFHILLK